jgi:methyl coenzyme M reductase gamma subunit
MHIFCKIRGLEKNFGSYMRTKTMEHDQGSYNHKEEFIGLHVIMRNDEIEYNGRRDMNEPVNMRILQREVQIYRVDNENIMKDQEEIL